MEGVGGANTQTMEGILKVPIFEILDYLEINTFKVNFGYPIFIGYADLNYIPYEQVPIIATAKSFDCMF